MAQHRYRCTACGNLTRFDVTTTTTRRAYYHFTVGGELRIEDETVVREAVEDVSCRWCGHGRAVEVLGPATGAPGTVTGAATGPSGGAG